MKNQPNGNIPGGAQQLNNSTMFQPNGKIEQKLQNDIQPKNLDTNNHMTTGKIQPSLKIIMHNQDKFCCEQILIANKLLQNGQ